MPEMHTEKMGLAFSINKTNLKEAVETTIYMEALPLQPCMEMRVKIRLMVAMAWILCMVALTLTPTMQGIKM